jgi:Flp pilus assembly protein TadD
MIFRRAGLLAMMALLPTALHAAEVKDHLASGSKFAQEKKYQEAAREFRTAVQIAPDNPEANLLLGLTLANTKELDEAVQYSSKAVQLKPSYAGFYNLGLIYANQEKFDKAVEAFEKAVGLSPRSYQAWHQLGKVYATDLKFEKAIEAYGKVIELNPKFADAYQGMGSAYYWNNDKASADAQVARLRELKYQAKADQLERWIKDKETKKGKAVKTAAKTAAKT